MRNRLKHCPWVFQETTEDERRDIRDIRNGIKLPRAGCTIILTVSRIPYPLVLVDDAERHHDHHVQLADDYGDYPLFHQTVRM